MNHRFDRRAVAIGVLGLAVAVALPLFAVSVANAGASSVTIHDVVEPALDAPAPQRGPARSIIYGTASGTDVTVYRQALPQGTPDALFSYDDPAMDDDAERQIIRAPELALSSDGRAVAYFSRSGLRVRHLDTGADEVVIGRYTAGMFSLGDIAFSPDGRFLSFAGHWYEYSDHWVIELATGRHWRDQGSSDLAWSPSSDRVSVAGPWYADDGQLAVSAPGDFGRYQRIQPVPSKQHLSYEDVAFAPDGHRIAFTVSDSSGPSPAVRLGISNIDGTGFVDLYGTDTPEAFAFSGDGNYLYSVERVQGQRAYFAVASTRSGEGQGMTALPADIASTTDLWLTPSGELVVIGRTAHGTDPAFSQRLMVFSQDGEQLESTPSFAQNTRIVGIG